MAELRELDPLAIAAHPQRLVLAWIDHPVHLSTPAQRVETLQPDVAQHLAERSAGRGFGLPLAVMTDAVGRPCALRRARVHPADVAAMRARCGSVP